MVANDLPTHTEARSRVCVVFTPHCVDIAFPRICLVVVSRVPRFARFGKKFDCPIIEKSRYVLVHICGCVRDQLGPFTTAYTLVFAKGRSARSCVLGPLGWPWYAFRGAGRVGCIGVGFGQLSERPVHISTYLLCCFHYTRLVYGI